MRTTTHVAAVTAAFLTTRQRCGQRREKKWSRKPVAALLAGFLMAVLAPTAAVAQHAVGSLYFLNRTNGSEAYGYIDRYGFFRQTTSSVNGLVGATHVVNTTNGLLTYNAGNGGVSVKQIEDNGSIFGIGTGFSVGLDKIVSIGGLPLFLRL